MTVFSRVADILQAKTHKLLDQLEDPNETLDLSYEKTSPPTAARRPYR
jgi:phage shock protein A